MSKNLQLLSLKGTTLSLNPLADTHFVVVVLEAAGFFLTLVSVDTRVSGVHLRLSLGVNLFSETGTLWGGGWIFFNKWNYLRLGNSSLTRTNQPNPTKGKAGPVEI